MPWNNQILQIPNIPNVASRWYKGLAELIPLPQDERPMPCHHQLLRSTKSVASGPMCRADLGHGECAWIPPMDYGHSHEKEGLDLLFFSGTTELDLPKTVGRESKQICQGSDKMDYLRSYSTTTRQQSQEREVPWKLWIKLFRWWESFSSA